MPKAIGMIEFSSIGIGFEAEDAMLKASNVQLLVARTICSGKYIVIVGGDVADVKSSVDAGLEITNDAVIDHLVIPNVHESLFPALSTAVTLTPDKAQALGIVETFNVASILEAADAAAKAAEVTLFRIHIAMAIGGKGFLLLTGDVSSTKAAVDAAASVAKQRGVLVSRVVIPRPREEMFHEYI
ncbi:MAG: BMC domain-containing protein [Candidatus Omnitrophota bacterium]|jgi:microcompartment protein CcmL/EutN|nr:MAG: BMC domain-containing protein [Candidatus Omnitrophota bacterium]